MVYLDFLRHRGHRNVVDHTSCEVLAVNREYRLRNNELEACRLKLVAK